MKTKINTTTFRKPKPYKVRNVYLEQRRDEPNQLAVDIIYKGKRYGGFIPPMENQDEN